jgi:GTP cyclohydrolase II
MSSSQRVLRNSPHNQHSATDATRRPVGTCRRRVLRVQVLDVVKPFGRNFRGAAMEIFCGEKVAVVEDRSNETCRCGEKLALVRVIVDSLTGDTVHLFKCQCGERTWQE